MLYLRTGGNGACKTLFTLADVRAMQVKESRPVVTNGRFTMKPEKMAEFGWKVIDFKDWQAEPDGTIFFIDECHNDMPLRANGSSVPIYISALAEHRKRGFDFFFLTQHPMNIDGFVRKLIQAPGYHQHFKRRLGGSNITSVLQWDAVNSQCEKDGSGKTAQITTRGHPVEVYHWYESASLHTAKVRVPKQIYTIAAVALLVPLMGYFAYQKLVGSKVTPVAQSSVTATPIPPGARAAHPGATGPVSTTELLASYAPRIPGLPQTAPRYDEVTKPTTAPYPAACVSMGNRCDCFTQQGTKLQTPADLCKQIVAGGFFMDWGAPAPAGGVVSAPAQNGTQEAQREPLKGNLGADSPVGIALAKQEASNVGDVDAIASMHRGRRASF